jgi:hypothetical protein
MSGNKSLHEKRHEKINEVEYGNGATSVNNTDGATIASLAALPPLEYDRQRKEQAERLGIRAGALDKAVKAKRAKGNDTLQGGAVMFPDVEPWSEAVYGV